MKVRNRIAIAAGLIFFTAPAFAIGTLLVTLIVSASFAATATGIAIAMAINITVSLIVSRAMMKSDKLDPAGQSPDPGNRQQVSPATDNKLPIVYGSAWVGGIITDMSISKNFLTLYFVVALCERTNSNSSTDVRDTMIIPSVYWGGKKCNFGIVAGKPFGDTVVSLTDESSGVTDTKINGKLSIYLYPNGLTNGYNTNLTATAVMQDANCDYKWTGFQTMTDCAFAIIKMTYSVSADVRGLQQTRFNVVNTRGEPSVCFYDYMTNKRYGAGIPAAQLDTATFTELKAYSDGFVNYQTIGGATASISRFRFDGVLDTSRTVMQNIQEMCNSCDTLLRYNEVTGKWGFIVQTPNKTISMYLDDSNIISPITINPVDLSSNYNVVEVKYCDGRQQDAFSIATLDLSVLNPNLLFPNEPVNKYTATLSLVNNDVRARLIANRLLEAARMDLQVTCTIDYTGIQLEAGDIVAITNANYGFVTKQFRVMKVTETFGEDGSISAQLLLSEYTNAVYDDATITELALPVKTSLQSPLLFGTIPAPVVVSSFPSAAMPVINVGATTSSAGLVQYLEIYYAASATPAPENMYFLTTSEIKSSGVPWGNSVAVPNMPILNIKAGNWYFFSRMVNPMAKSAFSPASTVLIWRPYTFSFTKRYLAIAYADDINGSNMAFNATDKSYFGIYETDETTPPAGYLKPNPSAFASSYTWYESRSAGNLVQFSHKANDITAPLYNLVYCNRGGRTISFGTAACQFLGEGGYANFVPVYGANTTYDPSIWWGVPYAEYTANAPVIGYRLIDLDRRSGMVLQQATTGVSAADGYMDVTTNDKGAVVVKLDPLLAGQAPFNTGADTYTASAAQITFDKFGRIRGVEIPDTFFYTKDEWTYVGGASKTFTPTARNTTSPNAWIAGQDLIFVNGILQRPDAGGTVYDYSETATTFTVPNIINNDIITCISLRSVSAKTGMAGSYTTFTRDYYTLTNVGEYTPSGGISNTFEMLFVNGVPLPEQDYDILSGGKIVSYSGGITGELCVLQWQPDKIQSLPTGQCVNDATYTAPAVVTDPPRTSYTFSNDTASLSVYYNGVLLKKGTDYTSTATGFTLAATPSSPNGIIIQQKFQQNGAA